MSDERHWRPFRTLAKSAPLGELPPARPEAPARPCIVHLVRAANGEAPFRAFLDAFRRHPPGIDHELVLAMKGFAGEADAEPYLQLAEDIPHGALFFTDEGLDLSVYLDAAAQLRRGRYCFVNSFSEPLADGWLKQLDSALEPADVGMVGATGSWASSRSLKAFLLGLPGVYRGVLPPRAETQAQLAAIAEDFTGWRGPESAFERLRAKVDRIYEIPMSFLPYEPFPAYHLRTNAFMIAHSTLAGLELPSIREKHEAHLLENGRQSLTRQIQRKGLRTLVVDAGGDTFDHTRWNLSRTFWQGDQERLLVADNQTRRYRDADAARRRLLSSFAWGRDADPVLW